MLVHRYAVVRVLRHESAAQRSLAAEQRTSRLVTADDGHRPADTFGTSAPTGNLRLSNEATVGLTLGGDSLERR